MAQLNGSSQGNSPMAEEDSISCCKQSWSDQQHDFSFICLPLGILQPLATLLTGVCSNILGRMMLLASTAYTQPLLLVQLNHYSGKPSAQWMCRSSPVQSEPFALQPADGHATTLLVMSPSSWSLALGSGSQGLAADGATPFGHDAYWVPYWRLKVAGRTVVLSAISGGLLAVYPDFERHTPHSPQLPVILQTKCL